MPKSILDAIKMGDWDYEPEEVAADTFSASDAMPGTKEKLQALAQRVACGLPLWHQADRHDMEAPSPPRRPR